MHVCVSITSIYLAHAILHYPEQQHALHIFNFNDFYRINKI